MRKVNVTKAFVMMLISWSWCACVCVCGPGRYRREVLVCVARVQTVLFVLEACVRSDKGSRCHQKPLSPVIVLFKACQKGVDGSLLT